MTPITNNKFFRTVEKQFSFFDRKLAKSYIKAVPNGGKQVLNICDDFDWKNTGSTDEVPKIFASERELIYGSYTTSILSLFQQTGNFLNGLAGDSKGGTDIYPQLYSSELTGFNYIFPHLLTTGNNIYNVNNSWTANTSSPQTFINSLADGKDSNNPITEAAFSFAAGAVTPGFGFDDVYSFSSTANRTLNVSFPLYNTLSLDSAYNNYCFVNLFTFQNLKTRTSLATYIPPKIYQLHYGNTQGGFYSPICVVTNLQIDSIGTTRKMTEFKSDGIPEILIPEAYKVNITFMELIQNSSNIFAGGIGGDKIEVSSLIGVAEDFNRKVKEWNSPPEPKEDVAVNKIPSQSDFDNAYNERSGKTFTPIQ